MSSDGVIQQTSTLRRLRRRCWKLLAVFVIGSAVLVGLGRLLAPHADVARPALERALTQVLGQPVRIDRVAARWPRLSPQVSLEGLQIGPVAAPLLDADRARLEIKLYNLLRPAHNTLELAVIGLRLSLQQDESGRWSWRLDQGGELADDWQRVVSAGDLLLRDFRVDIRPHGLPALELAVPEAQLTRRANAVRVRLTALPVDGLGESLAARIVLDMPGDRLAGMRGYAESPNFALARLVRGTSLTAADDLRAQMRSWFGWTPATGGQLRARLDLHSLAANGLAGHASSSLQIEARLLPEQALLQLDGHVFGRPDAVLIDGLTYGERLGTEKRARALVADRVELDYLHALLEPWLGRLPGWPQKLAGTALDLSLGFDAELIPYRATGRVEGLALALAEPALAFEQLDLALSLAGDALRLRPSGPLQLDIPTLYPRVLDFRQVGGALDWRAGQLALRRFDLAHEDFDLQVDGRIDFDGRDSVADLVIAVARLGTDTPRRWLPLKGIQPRTRDWLDQALVALDEARALITLFGRPGRWQDRLPPGALHSLIQFKGLDLAYGRDWPIALDLGGTLQFVSDSMLATGVRGRVADVVLDAPRIQIRNTRDAKIELELATRAAGAAGLARLTRALPLGTVDQGLAPLDWDGAADAEARVWLPVREREDWRMIGSVHFDGSRLEITPQGIVLEGLAGELPFSRRGLGPTRLNARVAGQPTELALQALFEPEFALDIAGRVAVQGLIPASWYRLQPEIVSRLNGSADFEFRFAPHAFDDGSDRALRLVSSLEGITLDLPPPLDKPADQRWPLTLIVPLGDAPRPSEFELPGRLRGNVLTRDDGWQLGLGFGDAPAQTPTDSDFIIQGRVPALDLGRWISLLRLAGDGGPDAVARARDRSGRVDLEVGDFRIRDASLGAVALTLAREQAYWRAQADGEHLQGSLRLPAAAAADATLVLDLAHLHWPAVAADYSVPLSPPSQLDPRRLPAIEIAIADLQWGELDLGRFRLQSHTAAGGLVIEQLSSRSDGLELSGNGRWQGDDAGARAEMRLRLVSDNLGRTLTAAGYDFALAGGSAEIQLAGRWPGSPLDLSLQRTEGTLEIAIDNGVIEEAGPGAGRLLGLVSLGSIPRRLRLDFSDVFGQGLAFDRIAGRFELADGIAKTDNLRIDAPAAEVRISGRTDLKRRRYDQVLRVRPGVGATLPIIGALAGGPIGAAAGAALEQIFSGPLKGATEVRYAVTGSFDDPVIEPVGSASADGG
ncbi:MAG: YhdP family protein [Wenzhouxiangellaceae bacterium]|nr:YhdP family protein [Wenzhouxiangellaceae bacterium]